MRYIGMRLMWPVLGFFCGVKGALVQAESDRPNIIFYLADDQNMLDYGCLGNPKVHTPGVDRLAREGMLFTRAYTAQAICAPSRSMLYTGNFPFRNGCFMNHIQLRTGQRSLVSNLRELGYEVILAGKSHVGPDAAFPWTAAWGSNEEFPLDEITGYIRAAKKPYCMVIASQLPHGPFPQMPDAKAEDVVHQPYDAPATANSIRQEAGYYENIRRDNVRIEAILAAVDASGRAENTLFAYAPDHGHHGKYTVYERGLNVPLVVRWPDTVRPGSRSDALVSFADIFPTFIEAAGGQPPANVDGRSFLKVMRGEQMAFRDYVYGIAENQNIWIPQVFPSRMVCDARWKYIRNANAFEIHENFFGERKAVNDLIRLGAENNPKVPLEELYDLQADPYEQKNLAADSAFAQEKRRLSGELERWMTGQGDYLSRGGPLPLFRPTQHALDHTNSLYSPPPELLNTLVPADYADR